MVLMGEHWIPISLDLSLTSIHDLDLYRGVATLHTNCHSSSLKTLKAALQATENLQQWQRDVNGDLSHSREISSSSSETSYHLREITLSTKIRETDESGDNFRGSMTLPLQKKPLTPTRYQFQSFLFPCMNCIPAWSIILCMICIIYILFVLTYIFSLSLPSALIYSLLSCMLNLSFPFFLLFTLKKCLDGE